VDFFIGCSFSSFRNRGGSGLADSAVRPADGKSFTDFIFSKNLVAAFYVGGFALFRRAHLLHLARFKTLVRENPLERLKENWTAERWNFSSKLICPK